MAVLPTATAGSGRSRFITSSLAIPHPARAIAPHNNAAKGTSFRGVIAPSPHLTQGTSAKLGQESRRFLGYRLRANKSAADFRNVLPEYRANIDRRYHWPAFH